MFARSPPQRVAAGLRVLLPPARPQDLAMRTATWNCTLKLVQESGSLTGPAPEPAAIWTDRFFKQMGG